MSGNLRRSSIVSCSSQDAFRKFRPDDVRMAASQLIDGFEGACNAGDARAAIRKDFSEKKPGVLIVVDDQHPQVVEAEPWLSGQEGRKASRSRATAERGEPLRNPWAQWSGGLPLQPRHTAPTPWRNCWAPVSVTHKPTFHLGGGCAPTRGVLGVQDGSSALQGPHGSAGGTSRATLRRTGRATQERQRTYVDPVSDRCAGFVPPQVLSVSLRGAR